MEKVIIGNWKMFKKQSDVNIFKSELEMCLKDRDTKVEYGIAVPSIHLTKTIDLFKDNKNIKIYAQDAHYKEEGAFTGDISYSQIKDVEADGSIVGHSERRTYHNESNSDINKKVIALTSAKMQAVLCVGETLVEYQNKISIPTVVNQVKKGLENVLSENIKNVLIAYEPVWAIGTGNVPKVEEVDLIIKEIRNTISDLYNPKYGKSIKVLYGGSVNLKNLDEFLSSENISGFLVGSASLKGSDFAELINRVGEK